MDHALLFPPADGAQHYQAADEHGHRLVKELPGDSAQRIIEKIGATRPGMANLTLAALSKVMAYAIKKGVRRDNPFSGIERYKLGHHHTWTDTEIAAFEKWWPLGTRERLAFALLLYTGQRGGDVCRMVRSDIAGGRIRVVQDKARKGEERHPLWIPIHPALARALNASPVVGMHHLLTDSRGQPLTADFNLKLSPCRTHNERIVSVHDLSESIAQP